MADGFCRVRSTDKSPAFATFASASGTGTIQASPAPLFYLYDSAGVIVTGFNGVAVTGYNNTALAAPQAWYNLDTSAAGPGGLLPQAYYSGRIKADVLGSDGITRTKNEVTEIQVLPFNS